MRKRILLLVQIALIICSTAWADDYQYRGQHYATKEAAMQALNETTDRERAQALATAQAEDRANNQRVADQYHAQTESFIATAYQWANQNGGTKEDDPRRAEALNEARKLETRVRAENAVTEEQIRNLPVTTFDHEPGVPAAQLIAQAPPGTYGPNGTFAQQQAQQQAQFAGDEPAPVSHIITTQPKTLSGEPVGLSSGFSAPVPTTAPVVTKTVEKAVASTPAPVNYAQPKTLVSYEKHEKGNQK